MTRAEKMVVRVAATLYLMMPQPKVRLQKLVADAESEAVYVLHLGVQWLGYSFMLSLSFTDNGKHMRRIIDTKLEDLDA
jgi:hypothetical protein